MAIVPDDLKYTEDHEWVRTLEDGTVQVGITDFAQQELGELVYVEVDTVGETLDKGDVFGTVEAVKTTSDLFMPITGELLSFNPELSEDDGDHPGLINEDPYQEGWIIHVSPSDKSQIDDLMTAEQYQALIE